MPAGEVPERERRTDGGPSARIRRAEDGGRRVAGRIEAVDHAAAVAQYTSVPIGEWTALGAECAVINADGVERRCVERTEAFFG